MASNIKPDIRVGAFNTYQRLVGVLRIWRGGDGNKVIVLLHCLYCLYLFIYMLCNGIIGSNPNLLLAII